MVREGPLGEGTQTDRVIRDKSCSQPDSGGWGGAEAEAELSDQQSVEILTLKTTIAQLASMIIF